MTVRVLLALLLCCLSACSARPAGVAQAGESPIVLLVSIDGLPASVPGSGRMPVLDAVARGGVRADWLSPSFPTATFPNHYTLATGLRPDRHGIVHNTMRDPALGRFVSKEASARDGRWWGGEPIWATLQRQGGIAATMFWPGSEAEIAGQRPRHWHAFDGSLPIVARVDQVLAWLDLPPEQRPNLLTLYLEQYDVAAHAGGMDSAQALQALQAIDAGLARLREGVRTRGLERRVDLVVLSDHGMHDLPPGNVRLLDERIPAEAMDVHYAGAVAGLAPRAGFERQVEAALLGRHDHYGCWRKAELPAGWHYGSHPRIPPIVCQADPGWRLALRRWPAQAAVRGEHGHAPEEPAMRAVFVASGPSFRAGVRLPAFDNVHVYPLLAHLLRIRPAANDGSLAPLRPALRDP